MAGRKVTVVAGPSVTGMGKVDFAAIAGRCFRILHNDSGEPIAAVDLDGPPLADGDTVEIPAFTLTLDGDAGPDPLRHVEPKL